MKKRNKSISLFMLVAILILFTSSCSKSSIDTITDTPEITSEESRSLPWEETFGFFYTLDIDRAQKEIPFPIIVPDYIPDKREITLLPNIKGPLAEFQENDRVAVEILYNVDYGGEVPSTIYIHEWNHPVVPPDPELNPGYFRTEIGGKEVIWIESIIFQDKAFSFYFNNENLYFKVWCELPYDETVKVVESIIKQMN